MSPAPPHPPRAPPDPLAPLVRSPAALVPPPLFHSSVRGSGAPSTFGGSSFCYPPALASIWGFGGLRSRRHAPIPSGRVPGGSTRRGDGDLGSWFRVGSCRRSWGEGCNRLSGCPQGPLPFPLPLLSVPVWREGLAPCPAWLPQRNLETQHKLAPPPFSVPSGLGAKDT